MLKMRRICLRFCKKHGYMRLRYSDCGDFALIEEGSIDDEGGN